MYTLVVEKRCCSVHDAVYADALYKLICTRYGTYFSLHSIEPVIFISHTFILKMDEHGNVYLDENTDLTFLTLAADEKYNKK